MAQCTCRQALPPSEIGEIAVPNMKDRSIKVYRFDMFCPVHRVITSVNDVPREPRAYVEEVVDKPKTARQKRQEALRKERKKSQA